MVFRQGYGLTEVGVNCFAMTNEDSVRKAALEMQAEEQEHVELVRAWMAKVPQPDGDWSDDPDPPRYID